MDYLSRFRAFYRHNPLSRKVLAYILAVSSVFAAMAAGIQLYADYRQDMDELDKRFSDMERTVLPALIDSLWRLDEPRIQLSLNAIHSLPYVTYISLESPTGQHFSAGSLVDSQEVSIRPYRLEYPLPAQHAPVPLGQLAIHVDTRQIFDALRHKFLVILGSQGAKTFSVAIFILLILHLTIFRHLSALAAFTERLSFANLGQVFQFQRSTNAHHPDELDKVAGAINQMRLRLLADLDSLQRAQQTTRKLSKAVEASPAAIVIMDHEGMAEYVNPSFTRLLDLPTDAALGNNWLLELLRQRPPGTTTAGGLEALKTELAHKGEWQAELLWQHGESAPFWAYARLTTFRDTHGTPSHYLLVLEDITTIKEYEKQVITQRHYDPLTQLPNRLLALQEIAQLQQHAASQDKHLAVLVISIDAYKTVAESLGIGYGDLLLRDCADIIRGTLPADSLVARSGEHEFLCALPFSRSTNTVERYITLLRAEFAGPLQLRDQPVDVNFSAGIALSPTDGQQAETLYKHALAAQQRAQTHPDRYQFFEPMMGEASYRRLRIATLLKTLCASDELTVYYQPIVDPRSGRYESVEALVRWHSRELDYVPPPEFIGIAEKTGDIIAIGEHIMLTACRQGRQWLDQGRDLNISVNVSPAQFRDPEFLSRVTRSLEQAGLPAEHLKLEITEQLLLDDSRQAQRKAEQLSRLGVRLAIDDFGTGYSSLSYLRTFPFKIVKIDQSFVRDLVHNANDRALVGGIIELAHSLGLEVIAEGVETRQHVEILGDLGCDLVQGYFYSKPQPAASLFDSQANDCPTDATS